MFNACICSKENIRSFRWAARGSPAQNKIHLPSLTVSPTSMVLFELQTILWYELHVQLISCSYTSFSSKEKKSDNLQKLTTKATCRFLGCLCSAFLLVLLAWAPALGSSVLVWGAGDQTTHTHTHIHKKERESDSSDVWVNGHSSNSGSRVMEKYTASWMILKQLFTELLAWFRIAISTWVKQCKEVLQGEFATLKTACDSFGTIWQSRTMTVKRTWADCSTYCI